MAFWFLAHHTPATGIYFGFGEATPEAGVLDVSKLGNFTLDRGSRIGGWDEGTWFNGGRAPELLKKMFEAGAGPAPIEEVAEMFGGLWEVKQPEEPVTTYATAEDIRAAIAVALDSFEARFQALTPEHGGMGHNGPPEDEPVTREEKVTVLKAVSDMRLALSSEDDPSVLDAVWSGVSGIAAKLGNWALKQVDTFFTNFTPAAGKALGEKWPYILVAAVDVYYEGAHVADLITMLLKLKRPAIPTSTSLTPIWRSAGPKHSAWPNTCEIYG